MHKHISTNVGNGLGSYVWEVPSEAASWRYEVVNVKGNSQDRYRDLKTGWFVKKL